MNSVGRKIALYRKKRKFSQRKLAELIGLSPAVVNNWENGHANPLQENLVKVANALNVPIEFLLSSENDYNEQEKQPESTHSDVPLITNDTIKIPVIGDIAAGKPIVAYEDVQEEISVPRDSFRGDNVFGLNIKGDSMDPTILDGDVVLIQRQPTARDGQIAAVISDSEEAATLKRVYMEKDHLLLKADNPEFADIKLFEDDRPRIIGVAVGIVRNTKK